MSAPEPGYAFPWERAAMRGSELPDGLPIYEQMAYISLRALYHDYHEKRLDRETASAEKRKIIGALQKAKDAEDFRSRLVSFHVRVIKDTEAANAAVRKNPSPENAIVLCNVLDGLERYRPVETAAD